LQRGTVSYSYGTFPQRFGLGSQLRIQTFINRCPILFLEIISRHDIRAVLEKIISLLSSASLCVGSLLLYHIVMEMKCYTWRQKWPTNRFVFPDQDGLPID